MCTSVVLRYKAPQDKNGDQRYTLNKQEVEEQGSGIRGLQQRLQVQVWKRLLPVGEAAVLGTCQSGGSPFLNGQHWKEVFHQLTEVTVPTKHKHTTEPQKKKSPEIFIFKPYSLQTYEDLLPLVLSWMSSPFGLTVNSLVSGTPTSL